MGGSAFHSAPALQSSCRTELNFLSRAIGRLDEHEFPLNALARCLGRSVRYPSQLPRSHLDRQDNATLAQRTRLTLSAANASITLLD
jgi:hypothetical protein